MMAKKVLLNLGCGRTINTQWINVDKMDLPGVDHLVDLDESPEVLLELFSENSVDKFRMIHVIEHLHKPLPLMEVCWRLAKPDAVFMIKCPFGNSYVAWEDPTHVRPYFPNSFAYFGQPCYWRADYGYRGDWRIEEIALMKNPHYENLGISIPPTMLMEMFSNYITEMAVTLRAVKPARPPTKPERPESYRLLFAHKGLSSEEC